MKVLQILVLIFGLVILANAQNSVLSGTVYDQDGSVIPNAKTKLKDRKIKVTQRKRAMMAFMKLNYLKDFIQSKLLQTILRSLG